MEETPAAGGAQPASDEPSVEPIDKWFVYRHSLAASTPVLARSQTLLHVTAPDGMAPAPFKAVFNVGEKDSSGTSLEITLGLRRNLLDVPSYAGESGGGEHYGRIVSIHEPGQDLRALIGHVSRKTEKGEPFKRDFFIATREERTARPPIAEHRFDSRMQIPLYDHQPQQRGDVIKLSRDEIVIERHCYAITLQQEPSGGLELRSTGREEGSRVGGLVLPMAPGQPEQHLLVVAYHHLHTRERHLLAGHPFSPVGSPGHPLCTNLFGAFQML